MANTNSAEVTALATSGAVLAPGAGFSKLRLKIDTFTLAAQSAADTLTCTPGPSVGRLIAVGLLTDTSLGSTTIQIGISGTAAKYKADGTFTTTDQIVWFMKGAAVANVTAAETIIATLSTATAPASGTLTIFQLYTVN